MTFTLDNLGNIVFEAENLIYAPCAELFADCYVTADGDVYSLNVAANEVEVNGVKPRWKLNAVRSVPDCILQTTLIRSRSFRR